MTRYNLKHMDFKYKHRLGNTWDNTGLKSYLRRNYPGATTVVEALQMEIAQRQGDKAKTSHIASSLKFSPSQNEAETQEITKGPLDL